MLMTANPCADAERWADEQDRREQEHEEQLVRAEKFFLQALSCEAKAWFTDPVRPYEARHATMSPDELLAEVLYHESSQEHIDVRRLFAELMTSDAAKALREEAARLLAIWQPEAGDRNV